MGSLRPRDANPPAVGAAWPGVSATGGCAVGASGKSFPSCQSEWGYAMSFDPRKFKCDDVKTWPCFRPTIIAHDVGRSRDRSTAVVGGNSPFQPRLLGIKELEELPQGLSG